MYLFDQNEWTLTLICSFYYFSWNVHFFTLHTTIKFSTTQQETRRNLFQLDRVAPQRRNIYGQSECAHIRAFFSRSTRHLHKSHKAFFRFDVSPGGLQFRAASGIGEKCRGGLEPRRQRVARFIRTLERKRERERGYARLFSNPSARG